MNKDTVEISHRFFRKYLQYITVSYFAGNDMPPRELSGYDSSIDNLIYIASANGDLAQLATLFAFVLSDAQLAIRPFAGSTYPFSENDLRRIIVYTLLRIKAKLETPVSHQEVNLVESTA